MPGRMSAVLAALTIGLSAVSPAHGQTAALGLAREAELQQLSVCPERPTVGVIAGTGAGMFITNLFEAAGGAIDLVERARLDEITDELCLGPAFDPATIPPSGGLLFAQYLVEVGADLSASTAPVSVLVVRVDTGAVIFEASDTLAPVTLDALDAFLQDSASGLLAAVAANGYACSDDFVAVIAEDVTLSCGGTVPQTQTDYTVAGQFTVEFTMEDFDYSQRGTPQSLSGTARVLPAVVQTTLADQFTRNSPRCAFTMQSDRSIQINLAGPSVPATYTLTIPQNTAGDWSFAPALASAPPLLRGPATMTSVMATTASADCTGPGGTVSRTTNYTHQELNDFGFGTHQIRPACGEGHLVPIALSSAPNLGTPNNLDITLGCNARSARARFSFRRRF